MQISEITKQKWFWPLAIIGGLVLVLFLSNRDVRTPEGLPVIDSDNQYQQAIRDAHEMTKPIFNKADAGEDLTEEEKKKLIEAATIIDSANRYAPDKAIPFLGAGKAYQLAGVLDLAEARLKQCYNNSLLTTAKEDDKLSGYEALYRLSLLYFSLRQYSLALDMANLAVKAEPNGVNYLAARARALIQLSDLDAADADLHAALLLDPTHKESLALHKLLALENPEKYGPKKKH